MKQCHESEGVKAVTLGTGKALACVASNISQKEHGEPVSTSQLHHGRHN